MYTLYFKEGLTSFFLFTFKFQNFKISKLKSSIDNKLLSSYHLFTKKSISGVRKILLLFQRNEVHGELRFILFTNKKDFLR